MNQDQNSDEIIDEKHIHVNLNSMNKLDFGYFITTIVTIFVAYIILVSNYIKNTNKIQYPVSQTDCLGGAEFCYITQGGVAVIKNTERIRMFHRHLVSTLEISHEDPEKDYETDITWE